MIPCLLKLVDGLPRYNIFPPWVTQSLMVYPQGKYGQGKYGISRVKGNPGTINTQKRISVEEHTAVKIPKKIGKKKPTKVP